MTRTATVAHPTTAIAHTGSGFKLPAGTYEVAELDGVDGSALYIHGPDNGDLVCINVHDPNITINEAA